MAANEVLTVPKTNVVPTITLTSLADAAARMSASADLGAKTSQRWSLRLECEIDAAPTAGEEVEVYLAFSDDNSKWPGGVTGSDAAYKGGEEAEWAKQLIFLGSLFVANDTDGVDQVAIISTFMPLARYVVVVIKNESGQAFSETAGDHIVTLIPMTDEIQ